MKIAQHILKRETKDRENQYLWIITWILITSEKERVSMRIFIKGSLISDVYDFILFTKFSCLLQQMYSYKNVKVASHIIISRSYD